MAPPREEPGLDRAPVFRQLNAAGRFARFGKEDAILPLLILAAVAIAGNLLGFHPAYAHVAFVASLATSWVFRVRFPNGGLVGLLRFLTEPRHLSAHAPDTCPPYPAVPARESQDATTSQPE